MFVKRDFYRTGKSIKVDFDFIYNDKEKRQPTAEFWELLTNALAANKALKQIRLIYRSEEYNSELAARFYDVLRAIENMQTLQDVKIQMKDYSIVNVPQFRQLKTLFLDVQINDCQLVEICKLNPNLNKLYIKSNLLSGNLADIVPYCNNLTKLELVARTEINENECQPLAELPKLKCLHIVAEQETGSFARLYQALASRESHILETIEISGIPSAEEIKQFASITSLKQLKCSARHNIEYLKLLVQLNQLKTLEICIPNECHCISEAAFQLLSRENMTTIINTFDMQICINCTTSEFTLHFKQEVDATELHLPKDFTQFGILRIKGKHKADTLRQFLQDLATQCLNEIIFDRNKYEIDASISAAEAAAIANIRTLAVVTYNCANIEHIDYLAQFTQIDIFNMTSYSVGSLLSLLHAFTVHKTIKLSKLTIKGKPISSAETAEIAGIQSLKCLDCGFDDIASMQLLANHSELDCLLIKKESKQGLSKVCKNMLEFATESKRDVSLMYDSPGLIEYNNATRSLTITMTKYLDTTTCQQLSGWPNLPYLLIYGSRKLNAVHGLLHGFANNPATALQEIVVEEDPLSETEVAAIAKIQTLIFVECGFVDVQSIALLSQLPMLENLRVTSKQDLRDISAGILSILRSCQNVVTITRVAKEISWNKHLCALTISNQSYENEIFDAQEYAPLAELENVKQLRIRGEHNAGSFKDLFMNIALRDQAALEEIIIEKGTYSQAIVKLNSDEIEALSKIKTLKRFTCGLAAAENIKELALLPKLQELTISTHQLGSLRNLFEAIANQEHPKLERLVIANVSLDPDECLQVSRITSLKKVELGISDGESIQLFSQLTQLEELTLTTHKLGTLATLFKALAALSIEYLNMEKVPLTLEETTALVGIRSLKKLQSGFEKSECIELLAELNCLKELTVLLDDTVELSFDALSQLQTLQSLTIRSKDLSLRQAEEISVIKSLTKLDCQIADIEGIQVLGQLNKLTELSIKSTGLGYFSKLAKELCAQGAPLQRLTVETKNDDLSIEAVAELANMKLLKELQIGICEVKSLTYLSDLKDLTVLNILSFHMFDKVAPYILKMLKVCKKLKAIDFHYGDRFVSFEFMIEALNILKNVRNPALDDPVHIRIPYFGGLTPEQLCINNEAYLKLSRFPK